MIDTSVFFCDMRSPRCRRRASAIAALSHPSMRFRLRPPGPTPGNGMGPARAGDHRRVWGR